jgi:NADH:ubiquinone oxidoreductase subunit 3 (subunit A)
MEKHIPGILAAVFALAFFGVALWLSRLVRPEAKRTAKFEKTDGTGPAVRIAARYQILISAAAMLFLGALVMFPAVVVFRKRIEDGRGTEALTWIGIFLGTVSIALAYAWVKGDLSWGGNSAQEDHHGTSGKRAS